MQLALIYREKSSTLAQFRSFPGWPAQGVEWHCKITYRTKGSWNQHLEGLFFSLSHSLTLQLSLVHQGAKSLLFVSYPWVLLLRLPQCWYYDAGPPHKKIHSHSAEGNRIGVLPFPGLCSSHQLCLLFFIFTHFFLSAHLVGKATSKCAPPDHVQLT